jgi:hypothetical protein
VAARVKSIPREGNMFEELEKEEKEEKQERTKIIWITAIVVAILAVVVAGIYITSRSQPKATKVTKAPVAAPKTPADPVRDLQIVRAVMGKDPTGLRVMWSVRLRNRSAVYTYSDIQYQAYFLARDGRRLGENKDTIKDSIEPGEEKAFPEFLGGMYDPNASTYQFVILGATATVQ